MSLYPSMSYADMADMPIVIATSGIALQNELIRKVIPELSSVLVKHGIIKQPISAILRKGRGHYVCRRKLQAHIQFEQDQKMKAILAKLLQPHATIDLDTVEGLTPHVRRKISVPTCCNSDCPYMRNCKYLQFRRAAQSPSIDIQVCNHNYFQADTLRRREGKRPIIPNYQSVIIDKTHKSSKSGIPKLGIPEKF